MFATMTSVAGEIDESLDPFAKANLSDPYRYYERLRAIGPVLVLPSRDIYLATTYDAVDTVLRDFRTFSSAQGAFYPKASTVGRLGRGRMQLIRWAYEHAPGISGRVMSAVMGRFGAGLLHRDPYPMTTPFIDSDPPLHTTNRRAVQPFSRSRQWNRPRRWLAAMCGILLIVRRYRPQTEPALGLWGLRTPVPRGNFLTRGLRKLPLRLIEE